MDAENDSSLAVQRVEGDPFAALQAKLLEGVKGLKRPRIYDRSAGREDVKRYQHFVKAWERKPPSASYREEESTLDRTRSIDLTPQEPSHDLDSQAVKHHKAPKQQKTVTGRTFTSKFRGVHQTFPTKRWEAQFRRGGKPTSLGCFDNEEEAARAYDRMMIWCHLHKELSCKPGITNYDMKEYDTDYDWLMSIGQEDLIESMRGSGRRQAATRQLRNKQAGSFGMPATQFEERQKLMHRPLIWEAMDATAPSADNTQPLAALKQEPGDEATATVPPPSGSEDSDERAPTAVGGMAEGGAGEVMAEAQTLADQAPGPGGPAPPESAQLAAAGVGGGTGPSGTAVPKVLERAPAGQAAVATAGEGGAAASNVSAAAPVAAPAGEEGLGGVQPEPIVVPADRGTSDQVRTHLSATVSAAAPGGTLSLAGVGDPAQGVAVSKPYPGASEETQ